MATGKDNKLAGQIGEHLVTAELGRRGIIATPFSGNVPDIDILAYANGKTAHIQVKAITKGDWQFDVTKFFNVVVENGEQVKKDKKDIDKEIICVFVALGGQKKDIDEFEKDEFFIFKLDWLQDYLFKLYEPRKPPKNIESFHCILSKKKVLEHSANWNLIRKHFGMPEFPSTTK